MPFCASRCGYCDFNTYTAEELGPGASRTTYADTVMAEIRMARRALPSGPAAETVFFGGGTPTLLGATDLVRILSCIREEFGLAPHAEITTEANPDSIDVSGLDVLRRGGFTRISFGVQSLADHVLASLERTHTPGRSVAVIGEARAAGFDHVSADLIYGTPGERDSDLRESLLRVIDADIDHLSAYALIVESGTRLAARIQRGEMTRPDDDLAADRYLLIDEVLSQAGLTWYEVSNWSRPGAECQHNLGYWRDGDWWGAGPGAHGHIDGLRWWNVKHPATYAQRLTADELPVQDLEELSDADRSLEHVMLRVRLREGIELTGLDQSIVGELVRERLVDVDSERVVLTLQGRLLADHVVRRLTD